jgi:hypothetical protein
MEQDATKCSMFVLNTFFDENRKATETLLRDSINDHLSRKYVDFNKNFQESYVKQIDEFEDQMSFILKKGFQMNEQQVFQKLRDTESDWHLFAVDEFKQVFRQQASLSLIN